MGQRPSMFISGREYARKQPMSRLTRNEPGYSENMRRPTTKPTAGVFTPVRMMPGIRTWYILIKIMRLYFRLLGFKAICINVYMYIKLAFKEYYREMSRIIDRHESTTRGVAQRWRAGGGAIKASGRRRREFTWARDSEPYVSTKNRERYRVIIPKR